MKRVIYSSNAVHNIKCVSNLDIARTASDFNSAFGITGLLARGPWDFLQVIEGPDEAIDFLVSEIRGDRRHWGMRILYEARIEERLFPEWSMAMVARDDLKRFGPGRFPATLPYSVALVAELRSLSDALAFREGAPLP